MEPNSERNLQVSNTNLQTLPHLCAIPLPPSRENVVLITALRPTLHTEFLKFKSWKL